jgi:hypothetical protein
MRVGKSRVHAIRLLTSLLVVAATSLTTPGAAAEPGLLTCPIGTQAISYNPGITLVPQQGTTSITSVFGPCLSPTRPDITSATSSGTAPQTYSCLTALGGPATTVTRTYLWNTGETTVATYTLMTNRVGGVTIVTLKGVVTAGLFAGSPITQVAQDPVPRLLECLTPQGVTQQGGTVTLLIGA